jgi:hypothetical protein
MGVKVSRIEKEFVLKSLAEKKLALSVCRGRDRIEARLEDFGAKELVVAIGETVAWEPGQTVEILFAFQNNNHTFSAPITAVEPGRIRIATPESIYKSLQRQFDRVRKPPGFDVSFRLAGVGSVELTFPLAGVKGAAVAGRSKGGAGTRGATGATGAEPLPAASFDPAAIKDLVDEFTARARTEASLGRIVMMRNRVAESYEERIMQATGKALWIPSTEDDFPGRDPLSEPSILTKSQIVQYERDSGSDPTIIVSRIGDILYRKRREGITSELFWPLLHDRYFVGYLHLVTHGETKTIARPLLEWVGQFARILSHSLERGGYFKGEGPQVRPYQAEAVDLSASGLLFAHPEKGLYKKLLVHSDIQVSLNARNRRMTVGGRVVRKFVDRDRVYVALRFLEIAPEDFRYLYETLYGRPFDPDSVVSETAMLPGSSEG